MGRGSYLGGSTIVYVRSDWYADREPEGRPGDLKKMPLSVEEKAARLARHAAEIKKQNKKLTELEKGLGQKKTVPKAKQAKKVTAAKPAMVRGKVGIPPQTKRVGLTQPADGGGPVVLSRLPSGRLVRLVSANQTPGELSVAAPPVKKRRVHKRPEERWHGPKTVAKS